MYAKSEPLNNVIQYKMVKFITNFINTVEHTYRETFKL